MRDSHGPLPARRGASASGCRREARAVPHRVRAVFALALFAVFVPLAPTGARADTLDRKLILRSRTEAADLWRQGWTLSDTALDARLQAIVDRMTGDRAHDTSIV